MPPSPAQIFLSYSRTDTPSAIQLRQAMEQEGFSVFHDMESIRVGDNWTKRLQDGVQSCSAFVLLVGRDGVQQQRWVGAEVEAALSRKLSPHDDRERLPIYPILLPEAAPEKLPVFLQSIQSVAWQPAHSPAPDGLIDVLRNRINPEASVSVARLEGEPYRGLSYFREQDKDRFFGRHEEVLEALQKLGHSETLRPDDESYYSQQSEVRYYRWLQVHASSGAGKSSLIRAGLLPKIRQGVLWRRTGYADWLILEPMMPGEKPLTMLAEKLARAFPDSGKDMDDWLQKLKSPDNPDALSHALRFLAQDGQAVLLVVDQFEELFTQSEASEQKQFDRLLAAALADPDCPFFLLSTIRSDFLDRFEYLPELLRLYNSIKSDYLLPTITESGLRELITAPARLSGMQVGADLVEAMVQESKGEPGALPLVESALAELWNHARTQGESQLSKAYYEQYNGVVGMLAKRADALINSLGDKGRKGALNLLLALTRINEGGRHTRRQLLRDDAVHEAGNGELGERVVLALSGERERQPGQASQPLRLIVTGKDENYVELVHEMLVRASDRTDEAGHSIGYWPTLYQHVHDNRDRDSQRQQLQVDTQRWKQRKGLGRYFGLAGVSKLRQYKHLRPRKQSDEGRYLHWSRWTVWGQSALLAGLIGVLAESAWWTNQHNFPLGYALIKPLWAVGLYKPLPEMVSIPAGTFEMGCKADRDLAERMDKCPDDELPLHEVTLDYSFDMGKYEVTFMQYDYYLWRTGKLDNEVAPKHENWGRYDRPVINVNRDDASDYTEWLGQQTERSCRFPSEAEWEYAARAGTDTTYSWGNSTGENNANCRGCGSQWGGKQTAPVGHFVANAFGLYDMHGNVREWVQDCYAKDFDGIDAANYEGAPVDGSARELAECGYRVLRGGSWFDASESLRSASRYDFFVSRFDFIGFRVVCSPPSVH